MSVVPKKLLEKIEWAENHIDPFTTNAVSIGTTVLEATAFDTKTQAARAALTAAGVARDASRDATIVLKAAVAALDIAAAGIVKQVRVKAETTGNSGVYALASIPAPATPSPVGPPGTPTDPKVLLKSTGAIELTWKCANPANAHGTVYHVFRAIGIDGDATFIGGAGTRRFTDETLPSGTSVVVYQVQALRSTLMGEPAEFIVRFGTTSGGAMTAMVEQVTPAKLAA